MSGRTINFPDRPHHGDLFASAGHVYEYLDSTWLDVTAIYVAADVRRHDPPPNGKLYMRRRAVGAAHAVWVEPEPLDLTPYLVRDGSVPMTGPLTVAAPQSAHHAVSRAYLESVLAPLRAELIRMRDHIAAMERVDDPRGRARGRTY